MIPGSCRMLLGLLVLLAGCDATSAAERETSVDEPAQASTGGEDVEDPTTRWPDHGRELIETKEQRYAREYGACDFRDPKVASPLDRAGEVDLAVDLRAPGEVHTVAGQTQKNVTGAIAPLVKALAKHAGVVSECAPAQPLARNPIFTGGSVRLRLVPKPKGNGISVLKAKGEGQAFADCMAARLSGPLADVQLDRERVLVVFGIELAELDLTSSEPLLDKGEIRRTIASNINDVVACYESAVEVWPELKGRVVVKFAISSKDGTVLDARVDAHDTGNDALACCVARKVYGWSFPSTGGKGFTIVTYPFALNTVVD